MIGLLDVGGTKLAAATAAGGEIGAPIRAATPTEAPVAALARLLDTVRGGSPLSGIALAVPGPFDRSAGSLLRPPGMPPSWHGLALGQELAARFDCPVVLENDANCGALAEALEGAGRGLGTVVYLTVSTGVGTGVVRDGRLVVARHDSEGGHQVLWPEWLGGPRCDCGGAGCLEALASGRAIMRRFNRRAEQLDDPRAWADVGRWLGLGVVNATALLDPDAVVFGGGVCASWERFAPTLVDTVRSYLRLQRVPEMRRGALPEDRRNLIGALSLLAPNGSR